MADIPRLERGAARRVSSSLTIRTTFRSPLWYKFYVGPITSRVFAMYDYRKFLEYWMYHLKTDHAPLDIINGFNAVADAYVVKSCIIGGLITPLVGQIAMDRDRVVPFDVLVLSTSVTANALLIWLDHRESSVESCVNGSINFIASSGATDIPSLQAAMREFSFETATILAQCIKIVQDNPPTWDQ